MMVKDLEEVVDGLKQLIGILQKQADFNILIQIQINDILNKVTDKLKLIDENN